MAGQQRRNQKIAYDDHGFGGGNKAVHRPQLDGAEGGMTVVATSPAATTARVKRRCRAVGVTVVIEILDGSHTVRVGIYAAPVPYRLYASIDQLSGITAPVVVK